MKKILVPTDFSENSVFPLKYAAELAKIHKAKIYILHITTMPSYYISDFSNYAVYDKDLNNGVNRIKTSSMSKLDELRANPILDSLNVECVVRLGYNIYNEIYNYAEELKPNLIIMGSSSTSKHSRFNIGSNTERVIRYTEIPVLVVRKETSPLKMKKVVFASTFEKDALKVYPFLEFFIKTFKPQVYLLYINTKSNFREYEDIRNQVTKFKKEFAGEFKIIVRGSKNIDEGIIKYAKGIKANLIALGVKRRKGLSLYLTDRITEGVVNLSDIPVLAIDNPK
jgi:nucleotide-binding universal stress UspA family protein